MGDTPLLALVRMDTHKMCVKDACIRHIMWDSKSIYIKKYKTDHVTLHTFIHILSIYMSISTKYPSRTGKTQNLPSLPHLYVHLLEQGLLHKCEEPQEQPQSNATSPWTSQAEEVLSCAVLCSLPLTQQKGPPIKMEVGRKLNHLRHHTANNQQGSNR